MRSTSGDPAASRHLPETAQDGSPTLPLSRPLFIYVSNKSYADKPAVAAFVDFYIDNLETITEAAKFIAPQRRAVRRYEVSRSTASSG